MIVPKKIQKLFCIFSSLVEFTLHLLAEHHETFALRFFAKKFAHVEGLRGFIKRSIIFFVRLNILTVFLEFATLLEYFFIDLI